jgi:hypothetical protein
VDTTVSSTTVANTFIIEGSAVELGLGVFLTEGSVFEELLCGIGWVPELKRSRSDGTKSQIIWLL